MSVVSLHSSTPQIASLSAGSFVSTDTEEDKSNSLSGSTQLTQGIQSILFLSTGAIAGAAVGFFLLPSAGLIGGGLAGAATLSSLASLWQSIQTSYETKCSKQTLTVPSRMKD
jgi:hypothetical protein